MPLHLFRPETCAPSVPSRDMPLHLFRQETCRSICSVRRHAAPSVPPGDTPLHLFRPETPRTLGNTCPALTGGPGGHPRPFRVVDLSLVTRPARDSVVTRYTSLPPFTSSLASPARRQSTSAASEAALSPSQTEWPQFSVPRNTMVRESPI